MYTVNVIHWKSIVVPSAINTSPTTNAISLEVTRPSLIKDGIQEDYNKDILTPMMTQGSFVGRKSHSSVIDIHTGSIYILGGTSSLGNDLNDVWILDTFSGTYVYSNLFIFIYLTLSLFMHAHRHME